MEPYISVREAAEKWELSQRRVQVLCVNHRIEGVIRFGHSWAIPQNAEKPRDRRRKEEDNHALSMPDRR